MKVKHFFVASALSVLAGATMAAPVASSGFDADAEGWTAINGAIAFEWVQSGGDPGGYVHATDLNSDVLWFFSAPSAYLGNVSSAYGGSLSYELKTSSNFRPLDMVYSDVQLLGANGVLLAYSGAVLPDSNWSAYAVDLVADGTWKVGSLSGPAASAADFAGVLGNLSALRIRGDYRRAIDTTGLDSVSLIAAPVPESSSALLLVAGLAGVAGVVRRKPRAAVA